ncbi:OmpA family protein [Hymenobacter sp. BT770]|uniref:OmpA family protein n=1 Tax=Hymenobacter sp. BT770 TaxID=2886942 RepID=UPI001D11F84F|nr:OmpA family protein [Hymenobacter sp. BT770]MCC3152543.1 OmpA family protein [Hymenobacter sp. BT770]MDO3414480.1 OmpA family protein [Hymenobacter sp. BT770]
MRCNSVLGAFRLGMMFLLWLATAETAWSQLPVKVQTPTNTKARNLLEKAQQQTKERDFIKAIETLNQLNEKFPSFGEPYLLKGSLLKAIGDNRGALAAYRDGLTKVPTDAVHASEYQMLGDLALSYGEYQTAMDAYKQLLKVAPKTQKNLAKSQRQLLTCEFALEAMKHPVGEAPVPLPAPMNSFKFQYFPALTADNRFLLFTGRPAASSGEDLFVSRQNKDGSFGAPVSISPAINTSYNEGAGSISGDGKTLVFASCDRPKAIGNCDLYISRRTGNNWSKPVNLGTNVNSTEWDSQPTLSADGRTLYFTSTRRGGQGQEDIYITTLQPDGNWSAAKNLGTPVNTPGKDMAPFIHASGTTLYYVTDGLVGMGGLDVFRCEKTATGKWSEPRNLGYPLNTFENEASLFITSDNQKGFCSRSRVSDEPLNGARMSRERPVELFSFSVPAPVKARETSTYTQGRVFDAITKKPLKAEVKLYDVETDELTQFVTSDPEYGDYTVVLNEGHHYAMYAAADKYLLKSLSFDYTDQHTFDPLTLDIYLEPVRSGRSVVLNNLFFDTNKYDLKPQSRTELNRLIEFLRQYRDVQIEVSGYTDNVGTPEANLQLSERRAQSVVAYLSSHGISPNRLRSKGYGEGHALAANDTEGHRQLNRRIELHIL